MSADKEKEKERPKDNNNERKPNESRPRPTLDIYSFNLIHLWNVSNSLNWMQLRKTISERIGKVKFIETFEAWTYKKIGHIVIEFEESKGLNAFVEAVKTITFSKLALNGSKLRIVEHSSNAFLNQRELIYSIVKPSRLIFAGARIRAVNDHQLAHKMMTTAHEQQDLVMGVECREETPILERMEVVEGSSSHPLVQFPLIPI